MAIYKRDDSPEKKQEARQKYVDKKTEEAMSRIPPEKRPGFQDRLTKARKRQKQK